MNMMADVTALVPSSQQDASRSDRIRCKAFVRDKATESILRDALGDLLSDDTAIRRADLVTTRAV
jgi:hypothetical protein